jgi:tetratricopeptide (TPR) repeat protein
VVEHNLQDIVSTVVVAARLAAHVGGERVDPAHAADRYHLGRHHERHGVADAAEAELRASVAAGIDPWARRAGHRLAALLQRRGEMDEALALWEWLVRGDRRDLAAARGYAIRLERSGQHAAALDVCLEVSRVRAELGPWWHRLRGATAAADREWQRREQRLRHRLRP